MKECQNGSYYHCAFLYSGNIIIETKFFDGDLQVSVSNVRVFYIWLTNILVPVSVHVLSEIIFYL